MKIKATFVCAIASVGLASAAPAYAGTPNFCPQVDSAVGSFFWHLTHHLPTQALTILFGADGVCGG